MERARPSAEQNGDICFSVLGCGFRVSAEDPEVGRHLAGLFRHLEPSSDDVERTYRVVVDGRVSIMADDEPIAGSVAALVRDIDDHIIARSPRLLLHAAGAELEGRGIALAARTGSGKSTLVAALVRAGFGYLTDEFVSPDWDTGVVAPYPRFVSIHPRSQPFFRDAEPAVPEALAGTDEPWQVDPDDLRAGSVAGPCALRFLVFPRHVEDAAVRVEHLDRAAALIALTECTFHFHRHGGRALSLLGEVVAGCECYRLEYGDVADASAALVEILGGDAL